MAGSGRRSLAAVAVSGCGVLFPARFVARAVLAGVRLSFSVSSSSPVVAAVRLALARSLRLGPPLGAGNHTAIKRTQPLRPWRRGKRNQQPRTTNALQCARREPRSASSRRALKRSQFARSPNRFTLTTLEARNRRTFTLIERWSPRAVLSLMPAGEAPWRAPGRHLWLSDASVGGPFAAPARDNAPPVRMSVAHSNVLGYRTPLARGGQHRRKLALRGISTMRR